MFFSLAKITQELLAYKYLVLFPLSVAEGPIVSVVAGFFVSLGTLNFFWVYAVVVLGDLVGDSLYYLLGYSGRTKFINRWGKYIGLNVNRIATIEQHFNGHSGKTILFAKWSHLLGAAVLFVAGAVKMPYRKFLIFNFLATLPKSLLLILIGFYFGQAANQIKHYFNYAAILLGVLIAIVVVIFVLSRKKTKPIES